MNEQYLQGLHTHLGITDDYNAWISAVKDNDDYLKGLHGHLGIKDNYDVWKTAIFGTKKEEVKTEQPVIGGTDFSILTEDKPGDILRVKEDEMTEVEAEIESERLTKEEEAEAEEQADYIVDYDADEHGGFADPLRDPEGVL